MVVKAVQQVCVKTFFVCVLTGLKHKLNSSRGPSEQTQSKYVKKSRRALVVYIYLLLFMLLLSYFICL